MEILYNKNNVLEEKQDSIFLGCTATFLVLTSLAWGGCFLSLSCLHICLSINNDWRFCSIRLNNKKNYWWQVLVGMVNIELIGWVDEPSWRELEQWSCGQRGTWRTCGHRQPWIGWLVPSRQRGRIRPWLERGRWCCSLRKGWQSIVPQQISPEKVKIRIHFRATQLFWSRARLRVGIL